MGRYIYYGVKVKWADGRSEVFRYDTEQQAVDAQQYQFVENWKNTKSAEYIGPRINWRALIHFWRH